MILAAGSHALCSQQFNYLPGYLQHRSSSNHQNRHFDNVRVIGFFFWLFFIFPLPPAQPPYSAGRCRVIALLDWLPATSLLL